jgi:hypothetical protein
MSRRSGNIRLWASHCLWGESVVHEERLQGEYGRLLREASAHFEGRSGVYRTLLNLVRRLDEEGIPYAVVGGMALGKYGYARMTEDVNVLMTPEGLAAFRTRLAGKGYVSAFAGASKTFRDTETQVRIEIIRLDESVRDEYQRLWQAVQVAQEQ